MSTNWKETSGALWSWLGQRLSGVFALGLVAYHFFDPVNQRAQNLLMAFVVFHAALGLRVILLDLGLHTKNQKIALFILLGIAAIVVSAGALWNR